MEKINLNLKSKYTTGDVVAFRKGSFLMVGLVVGISFDIKNDNQIRYNISINNKCTYSCLNDGDIPEDDVVGKVENDVIYREVINLVAAKGSKITS